MTPIGRHRCLVEVFTDKGRAVVSAAPEFFAGTVDDGKAKEPALARVPVRFSANQLADRLPKLFAREELWTDQSLRCLGCGACAYVCPACSCFDIQDECGRQGGVRLRCWDSCGFSGFTLHASGHNPRPNQPSLQRQRIDHKFHVYPEKFGEILCTGCGNCTRNCPVGMGVLSVLSDFK